MKYIKLNQGVYAETLSNINTVWDESNHCTPEALVRDGKNEAFDVTIMVETVAPAFNPLTQTLAEVDPIKDAEGLWTQTWEVSDLSTEDAAAMLATAQATAWENIKTERDRRKSLGVKVGALVSLRRRQPHPATQFVCDGRGSTTHSVEDAHSVTPTCVRHDDAGDCGRHLSKHGSE